MSDKPPIKLFIGYRLRAIPNVEQYMPAFTAPSNYTDPKKIQQVIEEKQAAFMLTAKDQPYTGTFDEVVLCDPANDRAFEYTYQEDKLPISVRVCKRLMTLYPKAWSNNTHEQKKPSVVFVGFDPRTFLKVLGIECSLPKYSQPAPVKMWYSNSDHRDISEAVMPKDFKLLTLATVMQFRRPVLPEDAKVWDALVDGWNGPGVNPTKDARIAIELAGQLGFLDE